MAVLGFPSREGFATSYPIIAAHIAAFMEVRHIARKQGYKEYCRWFFFMQFGSEHLQVL